MLQSLKDKLPSDSAPGTGGGRRRPLLRPLRCPDRPLQQESLQLFQDHVQEALHGLAHVGEGDGAVAPELLRQKSERRAVLPHGRQRDRAVAADRGLGVHDGEPVLARGGDHNLGVRPKFTRRLFEQSATLLHRAQDEDLVRPELLRRVKVRVPVLRGLLEKASRELRADPEVVIAAARKDGLAIVHADPSVRGDRAVALAAVRQNRATLRLLPEELRRDGAIALAYVGQAVEGFLNMILKKLQTFLLERAIWASERAQERAPPPAAGTGRGGAR